MALSAEDKSIIDRFSKLPLERQAEINDAVQQSADETGMGNHYRALLETIKPEIISLDEFNGQVNDSMRSEMNALQANGNLMAFYAPRLDKVVVPPRSHGVELQQLLDVKLSNLGTLAHEALHKVQFNNSPVTGLIDLVADGSLTDEARSDIAKKHLNGDTSRAAVDAFVAKHTSAHGGRMALFELTARLMAPEFRSRRYQIPGALESGLYATNNAILQNFFLGLCVVYGSCVGKEGHIVDIEVNKLVGKYGNIREDFQSLVERVSFGHVERDGYQGSEYLIRRGEKLDKVYEKAKRALKKCGLK